MKLLLDTHVLLWWLVDSRRLSERARSLIADRRNKLFWSAASSWELAVKLALGRIQFQTPLRTLIPDVLRKQGIASLPVEHSHAFQVASLPPLHRDPFDRMLVAQCQLERFTLLSADSQLDEYEVDVLW